MTKNPKTETQKHQDAQSHQIHQAAVAQGMSTVFERFEAQQPQCKHCQQGLSCQLCSDGPCRITAKAPLGVCGATGDLIVARNLLQLAVIGTAANTYQCRNLAGTLKAIGEGRSPLLVQGAAVGEDLQMTPDILSTDVAHGSSKFDSETEESRRSRGDVSATSSRCLPVLAVELVRDQVV